MIPIIRKGGENHEKLTWIFLKPSHRSNFDRTGNQQLEEQGKPGLNRRTSTRNTRGNIYVYKYIYVNLYGGT